MFPVPRTSYSLPVQLPTLPIFSPFRRPPPPLPTCHFAAHPHRHWLHWLHVDFCRLHIELLLPCFHIRPLNAIFVKPESFVLKRVAWQSISPPRLQQHPFQQHPSSVPPSGIAALFPTLFIVIIILILIFISDICTLGTAYLSTFNRLAFLAEPCSSAPTHPMSRWSVAWDIFSSLSRPFTSSMNADAQRRDTVQTLTAGGPASIEATMKPSNTPPKALNIECTADTPVKRKRPSWRMIRPEVGSLYDILHDHSGLSLFVRPLHWVDLHTELLGCRFTQLAPVTMPRPHPLASSPPSPSASDGMVSIGRMLDVLLSDARPMMTKSTAMASLIGQLYPESFPVANCNAQLDLRFGARRYKRAVGCQLLWRRKDSYTGPMSFDSSSTRVASRDTTQDCSSGPPAMDPHSDPPVLAYISRSHLALFRRHGFSVNKGPNGIRNEAVYGLQIRRARKLVPKNVDEDPAFLGLIVAMAQDIVDADLRNGIYSIRPTITVRLLTVAEEENALIVYTATVPSALLDMFGEPHIAPKGDAGIEVNYARVPVWPVLGFKERLGKALGSDLVGDLDTTVMDTYENHDETAASPSPCSRKRGREALSEVFNASFSEDRPSDCPRPLLKKRRRVSEGRVGIVR